MWILDCFTRHSLKHIIFVVSFFSSCLKLTYVRCFSSQKSPNYHKDANVNHKTCTDLMKREPGKKSSFGTKYSRMECLKAVFQKSYLIRSWILCLIWYESLINFHAFKFISWQSHDQICSYWLWSLCFSVTIYSSSY